MYDQQTISVTLTAPDGVSTNYKSLRLAATAIGVDYRAMRIAKQRTAKTIKGYALKFSA